jgi:hypothetical protein
MAITQTCVLHLIRNTFRLASRRDWDAMAKDLRPVYTAVNEAAAAERLEEFHAVGDQRKPGFGIIENWGSRGGVFLRSVRLAAAPFGGVGGGGGEGLVLA